MYYLHTFILRYELLVVVYVMFWFTYRILIIGYLRKILNKFGALLWVICGGMLLKYFFSILSGGCIVCLSSFSRPSVSGFHVMIRRAMRLVFGVV